MRFKFKLSAHFGLINPFWIDYILTPDELNLWAEYYELEPFLADRVEANLACISSQIYHALSTKSRVNLEEFFISKPNQIDKKMAFEKKLKSVFKIK